MKSAGNAFYILLVIVSTAFVATALAYSLPMDKLPEWFQAHGWKLLLAQVGAIILCGLLSIRFDSPAAEEGGPTAERQRS